MTLMHRISPTIASAQRSHQDHLGGFFTRSSYRRRQGQPGVVDLVFGDPHELPARALVECMKKGMEPKHPGWFAYTQNEPTAQAAIAASLTRELERPLRPEDIALTNGAFGGLMVCLRTVCAPGDEVI